MPPPTRRALAAAALLVAVAVLAGCQYEGSSGPRVGLLGDSISYSADAEIVAAVTAHSRLVRASAPGQTIAQMTDVAEQFIGTPPDTMIIELGANDAVLRRPTASMRTDIRRLLGLLRGHGVACVRWTNLPTTGTFNIPTAPRFAVDAARFNRVLVEELAAAPGLTASVAWYSTWIDANRNRRGPDGLHLADTRTAHTQFGAWVAHLAEQGCR